MRPRRVDHARLATADAASRDFVVVALRLPDDESPRPTRALFGERAWGRLDPSGNYLNALSAADQAAFRAGSFDVFAHPANRVKSAKMVDFHRRNQRILFLPIYGTTRRHYVNWDGDE